VVPLQIAQAPNNVVLPAQVNVANPIHQVQQPVPMVEPQVQPQAQPQALPQVELNPGIVLVNRNQNADDVIRNVQNNNFHYYKIWNRQRTLGSVYFQNRY
jgi:hypothetical protein